MSYRDNLLTIAAATVAAVEALTDQWEAGELPEEEFTALVAARVVGKPRFLSKQNIRDLMALEGPKHSIKMIQAGR